MNEDLRYIEQFIQDKRHNTHPSDKLLANFIDNKLADEEKEEVMLHLIECYECREIVVNINKYATTPKTINLKRWSPLLLVSASIVLFIFLPFKDEALLGVIDLSKVEVTEYQSIGTSHQKEKIIDADKILKEIVATTSLESIEYFNQAIEAQKENNLEEAKGLYNQSLIKILRNIDAKERLEQKIVLHYKLLEISMKQNNKNAIKEYKNIIRSEIRTYLLDYQKGK